MPCGYVRRSLAGRLSLTQQVALLSLVPIVALGFVLARVLQTQIVTRTVADASQSARLIARIGIQPRLSPRPASVPERGRRAELDQQLSARSVTHDLARIKIWNANDKVIYSDDHRLIGRTLKPSDELRALSQAGRTAQPSSSPSALRDCRRGGSRRTRRGLRAAALHGLGSPRAPLRSI